MFPTDKLIAVLAALLERSKRDEVRWARAGDSGFGGGGAFVQFPKSAIELEYHSSTHAPDLIRVYVRDENGALVTTLDTEEHRENWDLILGLWNEALRITTGWDRTLQDIERAINSQKIVGEQPPTPRRLLDDIPPPPGEDVPF
jgi:hypothetical protein